MSNLHHHHLPPPTSQLRPPLRQQLSWSSDIEDYDYINNQMSTSNQCGSLPVSSDSQHLQKKLFKQLSWSPDSEKEAAWLRRKTQTESRICNKSSVTDEDLEELKACIELGFGFEPDSPDLDPKLSDAIPALRFYCAVNKEYSNSLSRTSSSSSILSDSDSSTTSCSSIFSAGDDSATVKKRLKQWARIVAYSLQQVSGKPN